MDLKAAVVLAGLAQTPTSGPAAINESGGLFCDSPFQLIEVMTRWRDTGAALGDVVTEFNRATREKPVPCNLLTEVAGVFAPVRRIPMKTVKGWGILEVRFFGIKYVDQGVPVEIPMNPPVIQYTFGNPKHPGAP